MTNERDEDHIEAYLEWMRLEGQIYGGMWVAFYDGHLIGTAPSFEALKEKVPLWREAIVTRVSVEKKEL